MGDAGGHSSGDPGGTGAAGGLAASEATTPEQAPSAASTSPAATRLQNSVVTSSLDSASTSDQLWNAHRTTWAAPTQPAASAPASAGSTTHERLSPLA